MSRKQQAGDARTRDYEVGKGKPPESTRFKPGQSGNPRGKPKGSLSMGQLLKKALSTRITVTDNGKPRRMTKQEVIVHSVVNGAAKGDLKALRDLVRLILQFPETNEVVPDHSVPDVGDEALLHDFLARYGAAGESGGEVEAEPIPAPGQDDEGSER
jgi:hypothetical protein